MKYCRVLLFALGLSACSAPVVDPAVDSAPDAQMGHDERKDQSDFCPSPEEGCRCAPTEPVGCVGAPRRDGAVLVCEEGLHYCRDGFWTGCQTVSSVARPKSVGTEQCSDCNVDCSSVIIDPEVSDFDPADTNGLEDTAGPPAGIAPIAPVPVSAGPLVDTDSDGVPDIADDCPTTAGVVGNFGCPSAGGTEGFFHVLPTGTAAPPDPLTFDVEIREADIYFLMDTTGSMGEEINNLRSSLTTGNVLPGCGGGVIGALRCTIPETQFGVGRFDDYQIQSYGSTGDLPFVHLSDISDNLSAAQTAVNSLFASGGRDWPESWAPALHSLATGTGLEVEGTTYLPDRTGCGAGEWGYACFRDGPIPIVILITDAVTHNGSNPSYDYQLPAVSASATNGGAIGAGGVVASIGDASSFYRRYTGTTWAGSNSYNDGGCYSRNSREQRIPFTVTRRTTITIDTTGSAYDTVVFLQNSGGGTITCNDDGGAGTTSRIVRTLDPGNYFVRVDGYSGAQGDYVLTIGDTTRGGGALPARGFGPTWTQTIDALQARGIRTILVNSGPTDVETEFTALAARTNSTDATGSPFIERVASNGAGLSSAVVDAVVDLANFSRIDVDVVAEDVELIPGVDAEDLVDSIRVNPTCPGRCGAAITDGCSSCLPGTSIPFEVTFRNDVIPMGPMPQVFEFDLIVRGDRGAFELLRVPVRIVVPPDTVVPPAAPGWFRYRIDSADRCLTPPERPRWTTFTHETHTPGQSNVIYRLRTADSEADLAGALPMSFTINTGNGSAENVDLEALLSTHSQTAGLWMELQATLNPGADGTLPVVSGLTVDYLCEASE